MPSFYSNTAGTRHTTLKAAVSAEKRALETEGGGSGGVDKSTRAGGRAFYRTVSVKAPLRYGRNPTKRATRARVSRSLTKYVRNFTGTITRTQDGQVVIAGTGPKPKTAKNPKCNPAPAGYNRAWYQKGFRAGVNRAGGGDYVSAWRAQTGKPGDSPTSGRRIEAQESFYLGYHDGSAKRK